MTENNLKIPRQPPKAVPRFRYGDFATPLWRKHILIRSDHPRADGFLLRSPELSFGDESALQEYMNTFCGTILPSHERKHEFVLWCCHEVWDFPETIREYELLDYPEIQFVSLDYPTAKISKDFDNKTVTLYKKPNL